jgi:hypothetical protein
MRATNVSLGGCCFHCARVPAVDDEILIDLSTGDGPLLVQGTVVHAKRNVGFAIRFTTMDEPSLNRLPSMFHPLLGESSERRDGRHRHHCHLVSSGARTPADEGESRSCGVKTSVSESNTTSHQRS